MNDDALRDAIAEATAAFDAGNHAWGRFLLYILRPYRGAPPAPDPTAVRAALQDAALAVPQSPDLAEVNAFALSLLAVRREIDAFIAALPDGLRTGDILLVPDAFAEAQDLLARWSAET